MITNILARCVIAAALVLTAGSSASFARVLHAPGGGTVRALIMGVDKYPNLGSSNLNGAVADARDLTAALEGGGARVQHLYDSEVVRSRVIVEMDRLVNESKSGDLVVIAYSGHGMRVRGYKRWDGKNRNAYHSQIALANFSTRPSDPKNGHEVIVDGEMRAWYSRFDAKGVDVVVIMDTCYGGHMRQVAPFAGGMMTRELSAELDDKVHDSFVPIQMTEKEAGADTNTMKHVTFFAGATEESTVPEMSGFDRKAPTVVRGALSYFMARAFAGDGPADKTLTRDKLWGFLYPNVQSVTEARQFPDFGPRSEADDVMQQVVFCVDDCSGPKPNEPPAPPPPPQVASDIEPVRVAIVNGAPDSFASIEKGRAPFILSEQSEADVVWNVAERTALSKGDLIMGQIDASVLGRIIDRTWAVREIKRLATQRIIDVRMGEDGKAYRLGEAPTLVAAGVRDSYLTVVNVAANGQIQFLFPFYASHEPHMATDQWTYSPKVDLPLGTDYTVVIATSQPASDIVKWLRAHNGKYDAFELPGVLAGKMTADGMTRLGTAGLFSTN
jgi:hypothetical protein